jgi:hypothetical protein
LYISLVRADDLEPPSPFCHCVCGHICLDLRRVLHVAVLFPTYVTSVDNCTDLLRGAVRAAAVDCLIVLTLINMFVPELASLLGLRFDARLLVHECISRNLVLMSSLLCNPICPSQRDISKGTHRHCHENLKPRKIRLHNTAVICGVTARNVVDRCRRFGRTCCLKFPSERWR